MQKEELPGSHLINREKAWVGMRVEPFAGLKPWMQWPQRAAVASAL